MKTSKQFRDRWNKWSEYDPIVPAKLNLAQQHFAAGWNAFADELIYALYKQQQLQGFSIRTNSAQEIASQLKLPQ